MANTEGKQRHQEIKTASQDSHNQYIQEKLADENFVKIPTNNLQSIINDLLLFKSKGYKIIGISTYRSPDNTNTYLKIEGLDMDSPQIGSIMGWKSEPLPHITN